MRKTFALLGLLASLAVPAATGQTTSVVLVNQQWVCTGPVNLDLVKVTVTTLDRDAISLRNCSGRIGRVECETATQDCIKGQNAAGAWPHDLVIESGYVIALDRPARAHQDGISIMGGARITFRDFVVQCGRMSDQFGSGCVSAWSPSQGGAGATTPTDIVCDHCVFMAGASSTVIADRSIRSGARDSVVCEDRTGGSRWLVNSTTVELVNERNEEPPRSDARCMDFAVAQAWAERATEEEPPPPPPPPPPPYNPTCAPTCDEQIAARTAERDAALAERDQARADRDAALAKVAEWRAWHAAAPQ